MMTIAETAFRDRDFPRRERRRTPGNFTTVPISLPPAGPIGEASARRPK
jgi:hypothetical protein